MAKLGVAQIVSKLRKEYPSVYARLVAEERKPIPEKKRLALYNKALALANGVEITVPVRRKAFRVKARIYWECEECTGIEIIGFHPNTKATPKAEKTLLNLVGEFCNSDHYAIDDMIEEIREDVWKSAPCRSFQRKVENLQREFDACEADYNFDYERDIGIEPGY